jgi:Tfp pilus assembly protein PilV
MVATCCVKHKMTGQTGFTLIEVMAASLVFMLSLVAIFGLQMRASVMTTQANHWAQASSLSMNVVDLLQLLPDAAVSDYVNSKTYKTFDRTGLAVDGDSQDAFFKISVVQIASAAKVNRLRLTVSWLNPFSSAPKELITHLTVRTQ